MKVTIWVHTQDGCDGSAIPRFFNTEEEAEEYANKAFDYAGQRLCDDIIKVKLEFGEDGKLLNPAQWTE